MHVDIAKKIYEDKRNANFPKIRFTYIKLKRNFCKQCAPNFILREFAAIQTSQHISKEKNSSISSHCYLIVIMLLLRKKKD